MDAYSFTAAPKAVGTGRRKYRTAEQTRRARQDDTKPSNIMFDSRIHRGPARGIPTKKAHSSTSKPKPRAYKGVNRGPGRELSRVSKYRPFNVSVAYMHNHVKVTKTRTDVPLHLYLEEQATSSQVVSQSSQTDKFLPASPPKPYIPAKTGLDVGTQVDNDVVFQFDREVEPMLVLLTDRVLEQSLLEVRHEEQLAALDALTKRLRTQERKEQDTIHRLEQEEAKRVEEKAKMIAKARKKLEQQRKEQQRVLATTIARDHVQQIQRTVLEKLDDSGYFYDPVRRQVETQFLPHLYDELAANMNQRKAAHDLTNALINGAVRSLAVEESSRLQEKQRRIEEERKKFLKLYIHTDLPDMKAPVGPLKLRADATIGGLKDQVIEWMKDKYPKLSFQNVSFYLANDTRPLPLGMPLYQLGKRRLAQLQMHIEHPETADDDEEEDNDSD